MSGVDVMRVMDKCIAAVDGWSAAPSCAPALREARAAVAELVAEAQRVVDGTTGDLHYLRSALANVTGGEK